MRLGSPPVKRDIAAWQRKVGKPIFFTEVGWPSQDGCSTYPWNYYHNPDKPDMLEQQRCMDSFLQTFGHEPWVGGVLIWKWRDHPQAVGGPEDSNYTPYRKPVMQTIGKFFASPHAQAVTQPAATATQPADK